MPVVPMVLVVLVPVVLVELVLVVSVVLVPVVRWYVGGSSLYMLYSLHDTTCHKYYQI